MDVPIYGSSSYESLSGKSSPVSPSLRRNLGSPSLQDLLDKTIAALGETTISNSNSSANERPQTPYEKRRFVKACPGKAFAIVNPSMLEDQVGINIDRVSKRAIEENGLIETLRRPRSDSV